MAECERRIEAWRSVLCSVPEDGRALVISHGGIVEAGAIGCLPDADHASWGRGLDYCEGVRLGFDGEQFASVEILRLEGRDAIDERVISRQVQ